MYTAGRYITAFKVRLQNPERVGLGAITEAVITIINSNAVTGTIALAETEADVDESDGILSLSVTRTGGTDCNATVSYRTVRVPGFDFGHYGLNIPGQTGSIEWLEGDGVTKTITIDITDDEIARPIPGEKFYVELFNAGCAGVGNSRTLVTVFDNDAVGFLQLVTTSVGVFSNDGEAIVIVSRIGGSTSPLSVDYFTVDGTAKAGDHYERTTGQLVWQHGDIADKSIRIRISNAASDSGKVLERVFQLRLAYVTGTTLVDNNYRAAITIFDVLAQFGKVGFQIQYDCRGSVVPASGNCYYFREDEGFATLVVTRTGGLSGEISVDYIATNATKSAFNDFQGTSGTVTWPNGDMDPKYITINIQRDAEFKPLVEFFQVTLLNPSPLEEVLDQARSVAYVGAIDLDGAGSISISALYPEVFETDGLAYFNFNRSGRGFGSVYVFWETVEGTAEAGIDFVQSSGNVSWADGDVSDKQVAISLVNDYNYRFGRLFKEFSVAIVGSSNNTFVDPREERASVTVVDDNVQTGFILFADQTFNLATASLSGSAEYSVLEGAAATATLTVKRAAGIQGSLRVRYRTEDRSASSGVHYTAAAGELEWVEGDDTERSVAVSIIDDARFSPRLAFTSFALVLFDVELFEACPACASGNRSAHAYRGPLKVTATVTIEEDDGPGLVGFVNATASVLESEGQVELVVSRLGGAQFAVSVNFSTSSGSAAALAALDDVAALPSSCAGATASGVRMVQTAQGVREVYCDMSVGDGAASMFVWDMSTLLWARECTLASAAGGAALWSNLSARLSDGGDADATDGEFAAWEAASGLSGPVNLTQRPAAAGRRARPVALPLNDKVVWFDWESRRVIYEANATATMKASNCVNVSCCANCTGGSCLAACGCACNASSDAVTVRGVVLGFDELGISGFGGMDDAANDFYFISDGISMVHAGTRQLTGGGGGGAAVLIAFNWTAEKATWSSVPALNLSGGEWCTPSSDAFGHQLWTVNGRVLYRDCSAAAPSAGLGMVLGGPIQDPSSRAERIVLAACPGEYFDSAECGGWSVDVSEMATGLDLFAGVDADGFLHLGAWSASGGLFSCGGGGGYWGTVRTGIELAREVTDDFVPTSGRLRWGAGDRSNRTIVVQVLQDGQVDALMSEDLQVRLFSSVGATLLDDVSTMTVTIEDVDGPGRVTIESDNETVSERGLCCFQCDDGFPDRTRRWCASATLVRSGTGRGPLCVDVETVTANASGVMMPAAEPGVHFEYINSTVCWAHRDVAPKTQTVSLLFHPTYDTLFKTITPTVFPARDRADLPALAVSGTSFLNREGAIVNDSAVTVIEDIDANPGVPSFVPDSLTGNSVYSFLVTDDSATMSIGRYGGADTDVELTYRTEGVLAPGDLSTEERIPISVTIEDGSRGTNTFCLSNDVTVVGACADSSSSLSCDSPASACTIAIDAVATQAIPRPNFTSTAPADYRSVSGTIRWLEGDVTRRGVSVPLFHPQWNVGGAIYRVFKVVISSAELSLNGRRASFNIAKPPDANPFGSCSPEVCKTPEEVVVLGQCDTHSCREAASAEGWVVMEARAGAGSVRLVNTSYVIREGLPTGSIALTAQRVGGRVGNVSVEYSTRPVAVPGFAVAAVPGLEFANISGVVEWRDGDNADKLIEVPILDNAVYERGRLRRAFAVKIRGLAGGAVIKPLESEVVVVIVDDDVRPGVVQVLETRKMVREGAGLASVEVARVGGVDLDVFVKFHTGLATVRSSSDVQTGNSSAHSLFLSQQSYSCLTTFASVASANLFTTRRGGGRAELAFDRDNTTFWDSDAGYGTKWLKYTFPDCALGGVVVSSYTFFTAPSGPDDGCPAAWTLQGSSDGVVWTTVDERTAETCSETGREYVLDPAKLGFFFEYRWVFTADSNGFTGVRVYEVLVGFGDASTGTSSLTGPLMCNPAGECCVFQPGACDPSTDHTYALLEDVSHDFEYAQGLLYWPDGDNSTRNVTIVINDDCMGCSNGGCAAVSQLQDKPHESFTLTLGLASDVEIRAFKADNQSTYPFRPDAGLHDSFFQSVITILDDDGPGVLALWTASCGLRGGVDVPEFTTIVGGTEGGNIGSCPVLETARVVSFVVTREGSTRGAVSVDYIVEGINALPGVDFEATNGTLRWAHGDSSPKSFEVQVLKTDGYDTGRFARKLRAKLVGTSRADGEVGTDGGAEVRLCYREVSGICVDPARQEMVVTIVDVDAVPGTIVVDKADLDPEVQYPVDQSEGSVTIFISRTGGDDLPLTVEYETVETADQARACVNVSLGDCEFFPVSGVLSWADGDMSTRNISIGIRNGVMRKAFETFKFRISGVVRDTIEFCSGFGVQYQAGEDVAVTETDLFCTDAIASEVTVTIRETGSAGYLQFDSYSWPLVVSDNDGTIVLPVDRVQGSQGIVSVQYATLDYPEGGFGIANTHFFPTSGTVSWSNLDVNAKTISVSLFGGSVPTNSIVDMTVKLTAASAQSDIRAEQSSVRVVIQSSTFTQLLPTKTVAESSAVQGELNTITLNLECNSIIGPGGIVTISALTGSLTADNAVLPLLGTAKDIFGGSGVWTRSTGTLLMTVADGYTFEYDKVYTIQFVLQNPLTPQGSSVIPSVAASGGPGCSRPTAAGQALSCPGSIAIASTEMTGDVLGAALKGFSAPSMQSRLCLYSECPHSPLRGAKNYVTVTFGSPIALAATSTITITGLTGSSMPSGIVPAILGGMTVAFPSEQRQAMELCVCNSPLCSCEVAFNEIPPVSDVKLRVQLQCNSLGWGSLGEEAIYIRVGTSGILSESSGDLTMPGQACEDDCGTLHDLLSPEADVAAHVSSTGQLFVALHATSHVDFCGQGQYLRANITVTWQTEATDLIEVDATFDRTAGRMSLTVPTDYSVTVGNIITLTFPVNNPLSDAAGKSLSMNGVAASAQILGSTAVTGTAMYTSGRAEIKFASITESNLVRGQTNDLRVRLETGSVLGGQAEGVWVTIDGLRGAAVESETELAIPITKCTGCHISATNVLPLADYAGDPRTSTSGKALWDAASGRLRVLLRGQGPTYLIDRGAFVGLVSVRNSDLPQTGAGLLRISAMGALVAGVADVVEQPLHSGGVHQMQPLLTANLSTLELSEGSMELSDSVAYVAPSLIRLSVLTENGMQPTDLTTWRLPGLTTCLTLFDNATECKDISSRYLSAPNGSDIAGGARNALLVRWDESARRLLVQVQPGRAVCPRSFSLVEITSDDHDDDCGLVEGHEYICGLKVLPYVTELERGETWVATDGLDCGSESNPFCDEAERAGIDRVRAEQYPGAFWGQQGPALLDEGGGRAWFSVAVHREQLFVIGGVGASGFANVTRVSSDGDAFTNLSSTTATLGERGWFPTVSHDGFLWVIGGQRAAANSSLRDVWRSERGEEWCEITATATWTARHRHAALSFQGRLWVLGGQHHGQSAYLSDVWVSDDGGTWEVATRSAAFGGRAGHAAATHGGRMWVYGGEASGSEVWASVNGVEWLSATMSAGWSARNLDVGLVFDGKLWVVGGYNQSHGMSDVWWSADGADWTRSTAVAQWGRRYGARSVALNKRMWLLGGAGDSSCAQGGVSACPSVQEVDGCDGVFTSCAGADVWLDSFGLIRFTELSVKTSSNVFAAENAIHVRAVLDGDLFPGSVIVVSGLGNVAEERDGLLLSGPSARAFGRLAALDSVSGNASLVVEILIPAGSELSFTLNVRNPASLFAGSAIHFTVRSTTDKFALTRASAWTWVVATETGDVHEVTAATEVVDSRLWDGGVMFDVVAKRSLLVNALQFTVPNQAKGKLEEVVAELYYKTGEHARGMLNLSEWRSLGSLVLEVGSSGDAVTLVLADLLNNGDSVAVGSEGSCVAQNYACRATCTLDKCECDVDAEARVSYNGVDDALAFEYPPYSFCVNETYCSYDNVVDGACVCTSADRFECAAGQQRHFEWLGPQPTWTENTSEFMSSTLVRNVNITGVLAQSDFGFWHSGNGSSFGHEAGCVHLPICPESWRYNKDQWLAFDLGIEHTLASFRTQYPNFTDVPDYYFLGQLRTNIDEVDWARGQFKNFEMQTSARGLDGPWVSVLRDTAEQVGEGVWQTFSFEPATSRYWRLLLRDNYGFGYVALKGIEFFGTRSIWATESEWCQGSLLCQPAAHTPVSVSFDANGDIREFGLQLSAGTHALYLRTNLGVALEESDARLGDVHVDDGRLAVKVGSVSEGKVPDFAWESGGEAEAVMVSVDPQALTAGKVNAQEGFVIVTSFQMSAAAAGGTLVSIGDEDAERLVLRAGNGTIEVVQGSSVLALSDSNGAQLLASSAEYCLSAEFANGQVRVRVQGLFVGADVDALEWNEAFALASVSQVGEVVVGAKTLCGADTFDGRMRGASVYAGQLKASVLDGACRRGCSARQPDGSCYRKVRVVEEQQIETNAASDMDFMMLPAPAPCVSQVRLRVTESSSRQDWCIAELVLFHQAGPEWVPVDLSNASITAQTDDGVHLASFAADGDRKPEDGTGSGGGDLYCSAANETSGWILVEFATETCLGGYAILSLPNGTEGEHGQPSTWTLQGSEDGENWRLLHRQAGVTWQQQEWARFELDVDVPYLFVTNLFDTAREFGYNTMSRLYRWICEDEGWVLDQEIPTRGARATAHFEIDNEHFIAISETKDSTVIASARADDGRVSDTQVGSDVYKWTREGFVVSDTLSTNISLSMSHFKMGGEDYLVSADHRRVVPADGGEDEWVSILFRKVKSTRECETEVCPKSSLCGCEHCGCGELLGGESLSGGASMLSDPEAAFDGDDATAWQSDFTGMGISPGVVANVSQNLSTNASIVALEYNMLACPGGAAILGYSLLATAGYCPNEWVLQGSDDGMTWEVIDHQSDAACAAQVRTYLLDQESARHSRYRWVFVPLVVNGSYVLDTMISIRELELMFRNQGNQAMLSQRGSSRSFDFSQFGPPFTSVGRDTDGYPVSGFRTTGYDYVGSYGTFDIALLQSTGLVQNCTVGGVQAHPNLWSDPLAPFGSCAAFSDLCNPQEYPICFGNGTSAGLCSGSNASGGPCDVDDECGDGGFCAIGRRYTYRVRFRQKVRLILLRLRGCGWCGSVIRVRDARNRIVAERDLSDTADCGACREFKLAVLRTGRVFYVEEENASPLSVRASMSLDFETASEWVEEQLLPSTHAQDFEFFVIANQSYLAVANFRDPEPCYGSIACVNPRGSIPLVADTALPYNTDSFIYRHNGSSFELYQSIPTRGAVDWEHFMLSSRHHLCVANSFDAEHSSSSTASVVYVWNGTVFRELQRLQTDGARSCKYFESSGRHYLLLANSYNGAASSLESAVYVWDGSKFAFGGGVPSVGAAAVTPYRINNALYLAVANRFDGSRFTLNSTIQRVHDAVRWRGVIQYSDGFLPSATFVVRSIFDSTNVRDLQNNITVLLRPDRDLPPGCEITITGLVGSQTPTGSLQLSGPDAGLFANRAGDFDLDVSDIVFITDAVLPASRTASFSFSFLNGLELQAAVQPRIQAFGSASIPAIAMDGLVLQVSQVDAVAFTFVSVSESTSVRGAFSNTLTLSFRANTELPAGSFLELSGLVNSPTSSGELILGGDGVSYLGSSGQWVQSSGTLNLTVTVPIEPFTTVVVFFEIANPTVVQTAINPVLSCFRSSGLSSLPSLASDTAVFAANIGSSFIVKEVGDSTRIAGISNTIYVTMQPSTPLWEDTLIIIGNLLGATTLDSVIDLSGPNKNRFVDERASFSAESRALTLTVGPNCATSCELGACPAPTGTACTFPFTFQGIEFRSCTTRSTPEAGRAWCGIQASVASPLSSGWGYCECQATIPDDSTTIVSFDLSNPTKSFAGRTPTIEAVDFDIAERSMTGPGGSPGPRILAADSNVSSLDVPPGASVSSSAALTRTELAEVTMELWLKRSAPGSDMSLVAIGDQLQLRTTSTGLSLQLNGSTPQTAALPTTLTGAWRHVAVTWTSTTGRVAWYVGGSLLLDQTGVQGYLNRSVIVSGAASIGEAGSTTSAQVSMVRVWSVARNAPSTPSIRTLYNKLLLPTTLPSALILYYSFDTAGSTVTDDSKSGLDLAIDASVSIRPILRTTLAFEGFTYPGVTLDDLTASSVGTDPGGDVCISVWWQTSQDLGAGAVVNVTRLHDIQTMAPVVPLSFNGEPFALAPYARWDRAAGQLTVELVGPVQASAVLNFTVTLTNSLEGSTGRQLQVAIQDGSARSYGDEFQTVGPTTAAGSVLAVAPAPNSSCDTAAATVPYWSTSNASLVNGSCPTLGACIFSAQPTCACVATCPTGAFRRPASLSVGAGAALGAAASAWVTSMVIGECSSVGASPNTLSVTLQPDRDIPAGSQLILSGLTGSLTGDRTAGQACAISGECFLSVAGEGASIFEPLAGTWEQDAGRLTLTLAEVMQSEAATEFSFSLQNSRYQRGEVTPIVEVTGFVWVPPAPLCGSVLRVGDTARTLAVKKVEESTCVPCKSNTVTVTVQASVDLSPGDNISITNLTHSLTPSGKLQLLGADAFRFAQGLGSFDQASGTVDLTMGLAVPADQRLELSFVLHNGQAVQAPRVPRIRLATAGHDEAVHGPIAYEQADGIAAFSFGGAANASEQSNSSGADPQRWLATKWRTQSTFQTSAAVWLEQAAGSCCVGSCCPAGSCCSCSSLLGSGLDGFEASGVYFEGSPCETVCDMATSGGGWTLASVHVPGGNQWAVHPNASDEEQLQALYGTDNMWEDPRVVFGDWKGDEDVRTWAFSTAAGDGRGAGEQVMITDRKSVV